MLGGQNNKRKSGKEGGKTACMPQNSPRVIKKEFAGKVIIVDDDSDSSHANNNNNRPPKKKRPMPRAHLHQRQSEDVKPLHEPIAKGQSFEDASPMCMILENLRDQVELWSSRTQELESGLAKHEKELAEVKGEKGLRLQPQDQDEKYERLVGEIEELKKKLKTKGNAEILHDSRNHAFTYSDQMDPTALGTHPSAAGIQWTQRTADEKKPCISSLEPRYPPPQAQFPNSLSLGQLDYTTTPVLMNKGLGKLLNNINFGDLSHLRALCELDSRKNSRDVPLFCESLGFFPRHDIDYVIRCGPTAAYICDHPHRHISPKDDVNMATMNSRGLRGLRVLQLTYHFASEDGGAAILHESKGSIYEWKEMRQPPRFVYDLGQLFLHRREEELINRYHLVGTKYNVVVDMTSPHKPVWLVMRPEYKPNSRILKRENESPFQKKNIYFEPAAMGQLAKSMKDLRMWGESFDSASRSAFYHARELVLETSCDEAVRVEFAIPDLKDMLDCIKKGWSSGPRQASGHYISISDGDDQY